MSNSTLYSIQLCVAVDNLNATEWIVTATAVDLADQLR